MLLNRTILVVDHSESDRLTLAGNLRQLGFDCLSFENIYKLISGIDKYEQSLILLDTELPGIVGIDAARALKKRLERSGKKHIYIALSKYGDDFATIATKSGFDGYLHKPVSMTDLQLCLSRYFSENDSNETTDAAPLSTNEGKKLYSLDMFEEDEPEFIRSIVEIFVVNTPDTLEAIRDSYNKDDMDDLRLLAHKIKPHFAFFNATGLHKTMQSLEDLGAGIITKNNFSELIESAETESSKLIAQLKKDLLS